MSLHRLRVVSFSSPVSTKDKKENVNSTFKTELHRKDIKRNENGNKYRGIHEHNKILDAQAGGDSSSKTSNDATSTSRMVSRSQSKIFSPQKNKKHISKHVLSNKELNKPRKKKNVSLFSLLIPLNFNFKVRRNVRSKIRAKKKEKKEATNLLFSHKTLKMTSSSDGIVKNVGVSRRRRNAKTIILPKDAFGLRKSKKSFRPYLHYRSSHYFDLDCFFLNLKNRRRSSRMKGISFHVREKQKKTHNVCNYNSIHSARILNSGTKNIQNCQKQMHEQLQPVKGTSSTAWSFPIRETELARNMNTRTTQEKEITSVLLSPAVPNFKEAACGSSMVMAQNYVEKLPLKYKQAACGCSMVMPQNDVEKLPQHYKEAACGCSMVMPQNDVKKLPQNHREVTCSCSKVKSQNYVITLPQNDREVTCSCSKVMPQNYVKQLPQNDTEVTCSCSKVMSQNDGKKIPQTHGEVTCSCSKVMAQNDVKQLPRKFKETASGCGNVMLQNDVDQSCVYCDPLSSNVFHEMPEISQPIVSSQIKKKSKSSYKKRPCKTTKRNNSSGKCKTCVRHVIVGIFIVVSSPCLLVVFLVWGVLLYPITKAKYYDARFRKKSYNTDTLCIKTTKTCGCSASFHEKSSPEYSHPVMKKSNSSQKISPHDFPQPVLKKSSLLDNVLKTCYPPASFHKIIAPNCPQTRQTNRSSLLNHWYARDAGVAAIPYRTVLPALKHRSTRLRRGWEIKRMSSSKGVKGFEIRVPMWTSLSHPSNESKTLAYNNTQQKNKSLQKIINYPCSDWRHPCDRIKMSANHDTLQTKKSSQRFIHDSCQCISHPCDKTNITAYCDTKQKNKCSQKFIHNPCRCAQPCQNTKTSGYCENPQKNKPMQKFIRHNSCLCISHPCDKTRISDKDTLQQNKSSQKFIDDPCSYLRHPRITNNMVHYNTQQNNISSQRFISHDSCLCQPSNKPKMIAYNSLKQKKSSQKFIDDPCPCCLPCYKTKMSDRHRPRQNETLLNITEYEPVEPVTSILPRSSKARPVLQQYFSRIGAAYAKSKFSLTRPWQARRLQQPVSRKQNQVKSMLFQKDPILTCYYNNNCNCDYYQSLNTSQLCQACEPQCFDGLCCEPIHEDNSRARATFCEMTKVHLNCDFFQTINAAQQSCQACKPNLEGSCEARAKFFEEKRSKNRQKKCAQQSCQACKPILEGSSGTKATCCECEKTKESKKYCAQQSCQACKPNRKGSYGARTAFCECEKTKVSQKKCKRKLRCVFKKACWSLRNYCSDFWTWFNSFQKHLCPEQVSCRHLYIHTLRKRPCFCIHKMCPSFYPHFLNCYHCHVNMFWFCASGFALCFWWPIIIFFTLCLESLCCCIRLVCFI